MRTGAVGLALTLTLFSAGALAQDMPHRGTKQDQEACRPDAFRLCRAVIEQGDFAVLDCFKRRKDKLNSDCRRVLQHYGQI